MNVSSSRSTTHQLLLTLIHAPVNADKVASLLQADPDWDELYAQACCHEVLPLVYQGLKSFADRVPVNILSQYQTLHAHNTLRNLKLQKELRRLINLLLASGIPVIPYKGPVLADDAYGDLALRSFKDLDLLVPPKLAWHAFRLLQNEGYTLGFALPESRWPSLQRAINHLFLVSADRQAAVEIHWQVFHPMYVLPIDLSGYWASLETENGPAEGRFTPEEDLVIHCAHGTKHFWDSLKWIVDVQRILTAHPDLDWDMTISIADACGSRRALLLGLELGGRVGALELPPGMTQQITEDPVVKFLADDVWTHLFPADPMQRDVVREYLFYLRSRERTGDRWRQVVRWLFCPRQADWQVFPLGDIFYPLFYVQRPVRMLWKWVVRPLLCKIGMVKSEG